MRRHRMVLLLAGLAFLGIGGLASLVFPAEQDWVGLVLLAGGLLVLVALYTYAAAIRRALSRRSTRYGFRTALVVLVEIGRAHV